MKVINYHKVIDEILLISKPRRIIDVDNTKVNEAVEDPFLGVSCINS